MERLRNHITAFAFLFLVLAVFLPVVLFAGGRDFKSKIQSKISSSNVQYNLEAISQQGEGQLYYAQEREANALMMPQTTTQDAGVFRNERSSNTPKPELASVILPAYAIYKADYKAEIEDDVATVKGDVLFEVFRKGWTQIPIISSKVGLIDSRINHGASYIAMQGGKYYLTMDKPGRYNLSIEFLVKASREREGGPGSFNFEVIPAPISQFELTMPETGVDIFIDPAIKVETKKEANKTIAWAVMPNTNSINVRWTKAAVKEKITPVVLEPKLYADTATYAAIGEGLIRCQSSVTYNILQSEISNMRLALPEDVSVLEIQGNDLRDWKTSKEKGTQYLDVYLNFGVRGNYVLNVTYERKIADSSGVIEVPWVKTTGVEREKGTFGIAAASNVELAISKTENANTIDVKELPPQIWNMSANPILLAFKYLNHPFNITIEVTKHEELPVLVAAIDAANYISLQTDEGKILTKVIFQVRNNVKQFIHLVLPKDAELWSVFVAGKPVKPAKDKKGTILLPLEKSRFSGQTLTQFPVEIVYLDKTSNMGWFGWQKLTLPKTDIPISSLNWSLYLPLDYIYFNFGGNTKESRISRFGGVQGSLSGTAMKLSAAMSESYYDSDRGRDKKSVAKEQRFEQQALLGVTGVLPIKIDIPEEGRLYRFSKLLVTENENPWISLNFVKVIKQLRGIFWFLFWIAVVIFAIKFIKRIPKIIKKA